MRTFPCTGFSDNYDNDSIPMLAGTYSSLAVGNNASFSGYTQSAFPGGVSSPSFLDTGLTAGHLARLPQWDRRRAEHDWLHEPAKSEYLRDNDDLFKYCTTLSAHSLGRGNAGEWNGDSYRHDSMDFDRFVYMHRQRRDGGQPG